MDSINSKTKYIQNTGYVPQNISPAKNLSQNSGANSFILERKNLIKTINRDSVGFSNQNKKQIDLREYINRTYKQAKADINKPKGKLVKGSVFPNPVKQLSESSKTFSKALKGEGSDHSLGKLNDPALALGAVGIATILASAVKSPFTKGMQFVGAGAWLASMSLWPKVILAKPVKALTGVDLNTEYINSGGERKPFFQDPQYIPWDLMDDKTLQKAGKKLNVPENIPNRKEEIQERMTKVSTGVNTWWMLSAGASTPIMAGLIANRTEAPLKKLIDNTRIISAQAQLEAAGIDTGSKNPLVKAGKAVAGMFSKITNNAAKQEQKVLNSLLESGDSQSVKKFFAEKLGSSSIKNNAINQVDETFKHGMKNGKLTGQAKGFINQMYSETKQFSKTEKLWNKMYAATLEGRWGNDRQSALNKFLDILGIKDKSLEKLAKSKDSVGSSQIIADRIKDINKKGQTSAVKSQLEKAAAKPTANVEKAGNFLTKLAGQIGNKFKNGIFGSEMAKTAVEMTTKAQDKVINAKTSLGISNLLGHRNKNSDELSKVVRRIDSNDTWNQLKNMTRNKRQELLKNMYGKASVGAKKVMEFISAPDGVKNVVSGRTEMWAGESPANMLRSAAKDKQGFKTWFTKVGKIGVGALMATTAATLLLISKSAKNNSEFKSEIKDA